MLKLVIMLNLRLIQNLCNKINKCSHQAMAIRIQYLKLRQICRCSRIKINSRSKHLQSMEVRLEQVIINNRLYNHKSRNNSCPKEIIWDIQIKYRYKIIKHKLTNSNNKICQLDLQFLNRIFSNSNLNNSFTSIQGKEFSKTHSPRFP